jgi:hypothetical protein
MAGSPPFKVHDSEGRYVASARDVTLAAVVVAFLGDGARVKYHGRIIWTEGSESEPAGDSFDGAAELMSARILTMRRASA